MYLLRWFYVNVNFISRSFILVFALFGNKITMRDEVGASVMFLCVFVVVTAYS